MRARALPSKLPSTHDVECGRQMIDAMRAMLGLGPLYSTERPSVPFANVQFMDQFNLGNGNRRASPGGRSGMF